MPGRNDRGHPRALCMTQFALHRNGVTGLNGAEAPETVADVAQSVDFGDRVSATDNTLHLFLKRTAGTGTVDLRVYVYIGGSVGAWVLIYTADDLNPDTLVKLTGVWAGEVKVVLNGVTAAATWAVHESHSID